MFLINHTECSGSQAPYLISNSESDDLLPLDEAMRKTCCDRTDSTHSHITQSALCFFPQRRNHHKYLGGSQEKGKFLLSLQARVVQLLVFTNVGFMLFRETGFGATADQVAGEASTRRAIDDPTLQMSQDYKSICHVDGGFNSE